MTVKYINPFIEFGFRKIFGEEASKPLLIDFLNALLPLESKIKELSFKNNEQPGIDALNKKAHYFIYCKNENGEKFIVELQKAERNYFIKRPIYYSSFLINEQVEKGSWNYNFKAAYCVGILDFTFNDYKTDSDKGKVVHSIKLKNKNGKLFYDKVTYIYLEMPNFKQVEEQLKTRLDRWMYFIKNLEDFESIPAIFKEEVFYNTLERAELAKFSLQEMNNYQRSLKVFRDNINTFDYARQTAFEAGRAEGRLLGIAGSIVEGKAVEEAMGKIEAKIELVIQMKKRGFSIKDIADLTNFSKNEIEMM